MKEIGLINQRELLTLCFGTSNSCVFVLFVQFLTAMNIILGGNPCIRQKSTLGEITVEKQIDFVGATRMSPLTVNLACHNASVSRISTLRTFAIEESLYDVTFIYRCVAPQFLHPSYKMRIFSFENFVILDNFVTIETVTH